MGLFTELRRREVLKMLAFYVAGSWIVIQVADLFFPGWCIPESSIRHVWVAVAMGLPVALLFSWYFDIDRTGVRRTMAVDGGASSRALVNSDVVLLSLLSVLVIGIVIVQGQTVAATRNCEPFAGDLEAFDPPAGSIAVLPFANMSSDPEQDYFTDGISEEILNLLARMRELRVISRSTAFTYRGDVNIRAVAEELNVAYVLEGSVRKAGNSIRITAQLIDGRTDAHVWSNTWDRELVDIFAVQDDVARDVAAELEVQLVNRRRPTQETDPESYAMFLQARHLYYGEAWDTGDKSASKRLLRVVLQRDPDFVPALTLLALIYKFEYTPAGDAEFARLVTIAYELDPDDAVATLYKGLMVAQSGDAAGGIQLFETALELDPGNTEVLRLAALTAYRLGRFDDAIVLGERAISTNPLCIICYPSLLLPYRATGEFEKAVALQQQRIELVDDYGGWSNLGHVLLAMGRADEALKIFEQIASDMRANDGGFEAFEPEYLGAIAQALYQLDRPDEAAERINQLEALSRETSFFSAGYYASIGDIPRALEVTSEFLEPDPAERLSYILWNEKFVSLHDTPEWLQWREEVGLDNATLNALEFRIPDFGH